ncbi:MAG: copper resistance protein CopC/CopD [Anaerolineaceae bacterium]|nr:copper resistance protein CopC/CopD [Anaerolineaceae bacterium]
MMRHYRLIFAGVVLFSLLFWVSPQKALAHASLVRAEPAENSILDSPPTEIKLWLSEAISPQFSTLQLLDGEGTAVALPGLRFDPADPTVIMADLPELPEGVYSVIWKVFSSSDGHFTEGIVVFGVGDNANLGQAVVEESETAVPLPEVLLRWLNYFLLMSLIGAMAMIFLVLYPSPAKATVNPILWTAWQRILRWTRVCLGLLLLVGAAWALWQAFSLTAAFQEASSFLANLQRWLFNTRLGLMWWLRLGAAVLLLGVVSRLRARASLTRQLPTPGEKTAVLFLLTLVTLGQSLTSHAAALTKDTALALVADFLHLAAAGIWVGGLLALAVGLLPLIRQQPNELRLIIRAGWGPFSKLAALSVGILFATGLYSAGRQVASLDAMLQTLYGQSLLVKIGFVLLMGGIGGLNAVLLQPGLQKQLRRLLKRPSGWTLLPMEKMPRLILLEISLGVFILLVVSLVTAAPTANGRQYVAQAPFPETLSQTVDDMFVTLSVRPNQPGQNVITVRAVSSRKPPPAEINRIILRATYREQELGTKSFDAEAIEPGYYLIGNSELILDGAWQIDVVVRRLGMNDAVAHFDWRVLRSGSAAPVVVSNRPLQPYFVIAASSLLVTIIFSLILNAWKQKNQYGNQVKDAFTNNF